MPPDLALAALRYAERFGWAVLPINYPKDNGECSCGVRGCKYNGKHPIIDNGVTGASSDKGQIRDWWRRWPDANIGLATGSKSGVIVIDVDPRNKGDRSLRKLGIPESNVVASTGGGGTHYFVDYGEDLAESVNHHPASGVDVQTTGQYVILPPSLHASGRKYRWLTRPRLGQVFGTLPEWAIEANGGVSHVPDPRGEVIREGNRDNALMSLAGKLRREGFTEPVIYGALAEYNKHFCEPPLGDKDVRRIARSAVRYRPKPADKLPLTDMGFALRLEQQHGMDIRYSKSLGWLEWNGRFWANDRRSGVSYKALDVARIIQEEIEALDEKEAKPYLRAVAACQSARGVSDMLKVAESLPGLSAESYLWDHDPWLLNVQNGTIDLHKSVEKFRGFAREDYITKIAPVSYDSTAKAPRFVQFMKETFEGNKDTIRYLQKLLGYCLTGLVTEQVFPVCWGTGANGKTTLIEDVLGSVLGKGYRVQLTAETLLDKRFGQHPTELMDLRGARIAFAVESGKKRALDEEMIKKLTGGDSIKARRMHKDPEEFLPTHKLILITNNKPRASASEAIWRRLRLIAFTHVVPEAERDKDLGAKLAAESSGILNWLIRGCDLWQREGLIPPDSVLNVTAQHHADQDILGMFLQEQVMVDPDARCRVSELYESYQRWCADGGVRPLGKINFNRDIQERFSTQIYKDLSKGQQRWRGLRPYMIVRSSRK